MAKTNADIKVDDDNLDNSINRVITILATVLVVGIVVTFYLETNGKDVYKLKTQCLDSIRPVDMGSCAKYVCSQVDAVPTGVTSFYWPEVQCMRNGVIIGDFEYWYVTDPVCSSPLKYTASIRNCFIDNGVGY